MHLNAIFRNGACLLRRQILVGHPFDTVKVKLQSMKAPSPGMPPQYSGAMDVVRQVMRTEGMRGLYAGIQAPLPFVAVFNATLFAANGTMRRVIGRGRSENELSIAEVGLAGLGAGAAVSFVACPTELVKCRLQAQPGVFAGAIDCTRQVWASRGLSGLYLGMRATMLREMSGNSLYFMTYTGMLRTMTPEGGSIADLTAPQLMFAGGLAGIGTSQFSVSYCLQSFFTSLTSFMCLTLSVFCYISAFWAPCYPLDLLKTLIQTDSEVKPRYSGIIDCFRQTVSRGGVGAVYKGIGPCLARAFPANAVTFLAYEWTKKQLGS